MLLSESSRKKRTSQTATSIIRKIKFPKNSFNFPIVACQPALLLLVFTLFERRNSSIEIWFLKFSLSLLLAAIVFHYKILNNLSSVCTSAAHDCAHKRRRLRLSSLPSWMSLHDQYRIYEHTRMILKRLAWDTMPQWKRLMAPKAHWSSFIFYQEVVKWK